jgi:5-methylthioribose kinase
MGNYLLAFARAQVLGRPADFLTWLASLPAETWSAFETTMRELWPTRVDRFLSDRFLESWLRSVWTDAIGFAGCKAIRRIVGLAKVSDIETLPPEEHVQAATLVLRTARHWITARDSLGSPAEVLRVARDIAEDLER